MQHVVMYENVATKTFGAWMFVDCDFETYKQRLHGINVLYPDLAKDEKHLFQYTIVHYVGTFDELTGLVSFSPDRQVFDLKADLAQLDALREQVHAAN